MDIGVGLFPPKYSKKNTDDFSTVVEPDTDNLNENNTRKVNFEPENGYPKCCRSHYLDSMYRNEKNPDVNDLMERRLKIYFQQYPPLAKDASKHYMPSNTSGCNEASLSQIDLSEISVTELSSSDSLNDNKVLVEDSKFRECRFCSREKPPRKSMPCPSRQPPLPKRRGQPLSRNINSPIPFVTSRSQTPCRDEKMTSKHQRSNSENKTSADISGLRRVVPTSSSYYTPRSADPFSSQPKTMRCLSTGDLNGPETSPSAMLKAAVSFSDLVKRLQELNCSRISKKNIPKDVNNNESDSESVEEKSSLPQNTSTDASSLSDIFLSDEYVRNRCPIPKSSGKKRSQNACKTDKPGDTSNSNQFSSKVSARGDSESVIRRSSDLMTPSLRNVSLLNFDLFPFRNAQGQKEKCKSVSDNQSARKTDSITKSNHSVPDRLHYRKRSTSVTGRHQNSANSDSRIFHRFWIPDVANVTNTLVRSNDRRLNIMLSNYGCQAKVLATEDVRRGFPNSIILIEAPSKQFMQWCCRAIDKIYTKWNLSGQLRCLR